MGTAQATFAEVVRGGATGSDITGSNVTGSRVTGSDRVHMRNRFPRFFLTRVVVQ